MTRLLDKLGRTSLVYPHQVNLVADSVFLVELNEAELSEHSFLDERIYRPDMAYEWVGWGEFEAHVPAGEPAPPGYIFHIGHCGSTLLSRLVADATGSQALREPLPMRTYAIDRIEGDARLLAEAEMCRRLGILEKAWSQCGPGTVVKATSIATNLLASIGKNARLVFLSQSPETHLAVLLAGENAVQDLRGFGQHRYRRLAATGAALPPLARFGSGQLAALAWLAETATAREALEGRDALLLDFDDFLAEPEQRLLDVCDALDLECEPEKITATVTGPMMRRYSKATEHAYGAQLRADLIADSRRRNAREIEQGMQLIDRVRSTTFDAGWH